MTIIDTIVAIGKAQGHSKKKIETQMGYSQSYLSKASERGTPLHEDTIQRFRDWLGTPDLPLTSDEAAQFINKLDTWRQMVLNYEAEQAEALQPQLLRTAKVAQVVFPQVKLHYDLCHFTYCMSRKANEEADAYLAQLSKQEMHMNHVQQCRYLRLQGARALLQWQYKTALPVLLKVEKLEDADLGLCYNLSACYGNMGYIHKSLEWSKRAKQKADDTSNHTYNAYIRCINAENYTHIGRSEEALAMLQDCLRNEHLCIT